MTEPMQYINDFTDRPPRRALVDIGGFDMWALTQLPLEHPAVQRAQVLLGRRVPAFAMYGYNRLDISIVDVRRDPDEVDDRGVGIYWSFPCTTQPLMAVFLGARLEAEADHEGVFVGEHGDCRDEEAREAFEEEDNDLYDYVEALYMLSLCNDPVRWRT